MCPLGVLLQLKNKTNKRVLTHLAADLMGLLSIVDLLGGKNNLYL